MTLLTLGGLTPATIPLLETPDLWLRAPRPDDLPEAAALHQDPRFYRYLGGQPHDEETVWRRMLSHLGHWVMLGYGSWALEEKATGRYAGTVGFFDVQRALTPSLKGTPEAGWVLAPRLHGRGYARQALAAALLWADAHLPAPRTAHRLHHRPRQRRLVALGARIWLPRVRPLTLPRRRHPATGAAPRHLRRPVKGAKHLSDIVTLLPLLGPFS